MLVRTEGSDTDRKVEKRIYELYGETGYNAYVNSQGLWDTMPNKVEIDEREFWGHRSSYGFKAEAWVGHVKVADKDPNSSHPLWGTLILYLVDHSRLAGGGFAVVYDYNARDWQADEDKQGQKSVSYFRWQACDHDKHGWTQKNTGNCLNKYTCKGCGASYEVDSSG